MFTVIPMETSPDKVSYSNFLTTPIAGGVVLWQLLILILMMVVVAVAVYSTYERSQNQKKIKGNMLVGFVPEHAHEYECLCPVINGLEIKPPDAKQYKALTGGERAADLPMTYLIGPSREGERAPITIVDWPRGKGLWNRLTSVQVSYVRFREIDSNPLDPWCQHEIVDPIVVAAKTHRALAELILEQAKDHLEVFHSIKKYLQSIKPPSATVTYIALGAIVLLLIVLLMMSNSNNGHLISEIHKLQQQILDATGVAPPVSQ